MGVLSNILEVFSGVGEWISEAVLSLIPMFYTAPVGETAGSLTFLGVLAVSGLAISVVFLNSIGHYISDNIHESPLIIENPSGATMCEGLY